MIERRACLRFVGGAAMTIGACSASAWPAWAQPAAVPRDVRFRLLRGGSSIGTHQVAFRRDGAKTIAAIDVDIVVRVAFITAFRYRHSSEEVFDGGRLIAVRSTTNDNGRTYGVTGQATSEGFRIEGPGGPFMAPAALMTSNSTWNPAFVRQQALINVQQGGQCGLVASRVGSEAVLIQGAALDAAKYRAVTPHCAGHVWYAPDGRWVRAVLEMRGETVEYVAG